MKKDDIERLKKLSTELGKFILDITKLVFGGVILSSIVTSTVNRGYLLLVGAIVVIIGVVSGFIFLNIGLKKYRRK